MGNNQAEARLRSMVPNNQSIEIVVENNQPCYSTGDFIEGNIYVMVRQQHANFNVLRL